MHSPKASDSAENAVRNICEQQGLSSCVRFAVSELSRCLQLTPYQLLAETDLASMPSPSHSLPSEAVSSVEGSEAEACTALMDMYQCTLHDPAPEYLQSLKTLFGQVRFLSNDLAILHSDQHVGILLCSLDIPCPAYMCQESCNSALLQSPTFRTAQKLCSFMFCSVQAAALPM